MKQTSVTKPAAPSEAQETTLPVEALALTAEDLPPISAPAPGTPAHVPASEDNRAYPRHWGINE